MNTAWIPESFTPGLDRNDPEGFDPIHGPGQDAFRANPFPYYQWFRENGWPVIRLRNLKNESGKDTVWVLSNEHVGQVVGQPALFCRQMKNLPPMVPNAAGLLNMDPPAYPAMRAAVQPLFDHAHHEETDRITQLIDEAFDVFCDAATQRPVDWVKGFAMPVSEQVFYTVYGVPLADANQQATEVKAAVAKTTVAGDTPSLLPLAQVTAAMAKPPGSLLEQLMQLPRFQPGNSAEQLTNAASLALGGFVTIRWFVSLMAYRLLQNGGAALSHLRHHRGHSDRDAVAELLRFDAPIPMVKRYPHEAVQLGKVQLNIDDVVMVMYASASRDAALCGTTGEVLDFHRQGVGHAWAFGGPGMHHCVGSGLMYTVANRVLHRLRAQDVAPRLAPVDQPVVWDKGGMFRPLHALTIQA